MFSPQNFGGGIKVGSRGTLFLPLLNQSSTDDLVIEVTVNRLRQGEGTSQLPADTIVHPPLLRGKLVPGKENEVATYTLDTSQVDQITAMIPLATERIPPGSHSLSLRVLSPTPELATKRDFETVWPEMPRSLRDFGYALQSLQHILTPDELDSLRSGNDAEVMARFEEFWTAKDRTPENAYNEVMNEYYRRVDHAMETFGTLLRPDGSKTDRGRIYILFGPPTRSERKLDPSGFIEVWSYETAGKQFIFLDDTKTGNYVLTSTRPL
jgi:GWxTD domain-containing protein